MNIGISRIKMFDYELHHYDKEIMKQSASGIGTIEVNPTSDLETIRVLINKLCDEGPDSPKLSPDWCFIDCKWKLLFVVNSPLIANEIFIQKPQRVQLSAVSESTELKRICIMSATLHWM